MRDKLRPTPYLPHQWSSKSQRTTIGKVIFSITSYELFSHNWTTFAMLNLLRQLKNPFFLSVLLHYMSGSLKRYYQQIL